MDIAIKESSVNYDEDAGKIGEVLNISYDAETQTIALNLEIGGKGHYFTILVDKDMFDLAVKKVIENPVE